MIRAAILVAVGLLAFPVAVLTLASLGGWPGVAGIGACLVLFVALTIRHDRVP